MQTTHPVADVEPDFGVVVRPDILWIALAAHLEDEIPSRAVGALRAAAEALGAALRTVDGNARLVPGRFDFGAASTDKAARASVGDVRLNGLVTLPLPPEADFWARAHLAARAVESLGEVARAVAKSKPPIKLHWRNPTARVADVESHRAALVARWNAHVRALTADLSNGSSSGWDVPDEIATVPISYDEARLFLVPQSRASARRSQ